MCNGNQFTHRKEFFTRLKIEMSYQKKRANRHQSIGDREFFVDLMLLPCFALTQVMIMVVSLMVVYKVPLILVEKYLASRECVGRFSGMKGRCCAHGILYVGDGVENRNMKFIKLNIMGNINLLWHSNK